MPKHFIAIDVGGTKIDVCFFDVTYSLRNRITVSTDSLEKGSLSFLDGIEKILDTHVTEDTKKIGLSFNCVVDKNRIVYSSLLGGLVQYPIAEIYSKKYGIPVSINNDVHCMALAEIHSPAANNAHSFVLINLGTGIRHSFVYNGTSISGSTNNAGEICLTNIYVKELDITVKIDNLVSGKGIATLYKHITGKEKTAKEIFSISKEDSDAAYVIHIFTIYFAQYLQTLSYMYNPQRVIINGSLKHSSDQYLDKSIALYKAETPSFFHIEDFVISHNDVAAALGALYTSR